MNRFLIVLVLSVWCSHVALAAEERAADAMVARGLELRREGKPQQALEMFQRAHALAASPRTFGQMGIVEGTLEHWTDAENHLTAALAVPDDAWVRKNQTLLQTALESVKGHIGQLVFAGTAGATVTVAGKLAGTLPNIPPVRVGAGTVLVTANASGSRQFVQSVAVPAGMQIAVTINLEPIDVRPPVSASPPAQAAPAPTIREFHPHYAWKTWTGGGLLAVGVGVMTWGIVWIAVDGNGSGGTCADPSAMNCMPVYNTRSPGWILTAAGAGTAAAGGYLLYSSQKNGTDVTVSLGPNSVG